MPHYFANTHFVGASLNYIDKFVWNGAIEDCNPKLLMQEGSQYLCNHIFGTRELWHSHTGVFIRVDEYSRRLLNVNINYLDELSPDDQKRVIVITTSITDQFNQQNYKPYLSSDDNESNIGLVRDHMRDMHNFNKSVLRQLITEQMCKRISLT